MGKYASIATLLGKNSQAHPLPLLKKLLEDLQFNPSRWGYIDYCDPPYYQAPCQTTHALAVAIMQEPGLVDAVLYHIGGGLGRCVTWPLYPSRDDGQGAVVKAACQVVGSLCRWPSMQLTMQLTLKSDLFLNTLAGGSHSE